MTLLSTRIGLISDIHARFEPLKQALEIFAREKVERILCAGDIAGYYEELDQCITLLQQSGCQTILGNHDQTFLQQQAETDHHAVDFLSNLPTSLQFTVEDQSLYMVHAEPPDLLHGGIKLLNQKGGLIASRQQSWSEQLKHFDHDILIVGHTHQVYALPLGKVFVINPGSSAFNHSCMVLDLPEMQVKTFALENKSIIKCWNFSMLYASGNPYPTDTKTRNPSSK